MQEERRKRELLPAYLFPAQFNSMQLAAQQTNDKESESRADIPQFAAGKFI